MATPGAPEPTRGVAIRVIFSLVIGVLGFMAMLVASSISGIYWVFPGGCTLLGVGLAVTAFWKSRFAMGFAVAVALAPLAMEFLNWMGVQSANLTLLSIGATIGLYVVCLLMLTGRLAARGAQPSAEKARSAGQDV